MPEPSNLQEKFLTILEKQSFSELEQYASPLTWKEMTPQERQQLAELFVYYGRNLLSEDEKKASKVFTTAKKVMPKEADIYYKVGVAYTSRPGNAQALRHAVAEFRAAIAIDPNHYDSWYALGNLWAALGTTESMSDYFQSAQECFVEAEKLVQKKKLKQQRQNLYHSWGLLKAHQGQAFGEAVDFHEALTYFDKAEKEGLTTVAFYNDYGFVLKQLGYLVSNPSLFIDALRRFKQAETLAPADTTTLVNLAQILAPLYELTDNIDFFNEAHQCHATVLKAHPEAEELWITWAFILSHYGKAYANTDVLLASFDKFERAVKRAPNYPPLLLRWSDALRAYGVLEEDIGALKESEAKAHNVLERYPDLAESWYSLALSQCEIGKYFEDQAMIESSNKTLEQGFAALGEQAHILWYGITQTNMALGEITEEAHYFSTAIQAFEKCVDNGCKLTPQMLNAWGIAYMKLAEASDNEEHVYQAIDKFEQTMALAPQIMPEWLYNYACAYDFLGDMTGEIEYYESAIQLLNRVIEIDPTDMTVHHSLAVTCSHLGETLGDVDCLAKAAEIFAYVSRQDPEDDTVLSGWGTSLLHQAYLMHDPIVPQKSEKLFKEAEEKLQQAVAMGSEQALYNLACLNVLVKNNKAAMYYLEKADQADTLPTVDEMLQDEWLNDLRETPEFKGFLAMLINRKDK